MMKRASLPNSSLDQVVPAGPTDEWPCACRPFQEANALEHGEHRPSLSSSLLTSDHKGEDMEVPTVAASHLQKQCSTAREAVIKKEEITIEMLGDEGYFDMPLSQAAELLGLSAGSLKRVCRKLGLARWPFRVRKSLRAVIAKTEEFMDDAEAGDSKLEVLQSLRAQMEDVKSISGQGIDETTRKYRQAIFKLNHKISKRPGSREQHGRFKVPAAAAEQMRQAPHRVAPSNCSRPPSTPQTESSSGDMTAMWPGPHLYPLSTYSTSIPAPAPFPESPYSTSPWQSQGHTPSSTPERIGSLASFTSDLSPTASSACARASDPCILDSTVLGHDLQQCRTSMAEEVLQDLLRKRHRTGHGQASTGWLELQLSRQQYLSQARMGYGGMQTPVSGANSIGHSSHSPIARAPGVLPEVHRGFDFPCSPMVKREYIEQSAQGGHQHACRPPVGHMGWSGADATLTTQARHSLPTFLEGRAIPWSPAQPRLASPGAGLAEFDDLAATLGQDQQLGRQEQAGHAPRENECGAPVLSLSGAGHAGTVEEDADMLDLMLDMGLL